MAKIQIKHYDAVTSGEYYATSKKIDKVNDSDEEYIEIEVFHDGASINIWFDKSTAIRFAKTLRTEINKIES